MPDTWLRPAASLLTSRPIRKSLLATLIGCMPGPMISVRIKPLGEVLLKYNDNPGGNPLRLYPPISSTRTTFMDGLWTALA
jgi:hypothetical protein